jgi:hypothetical protein
LILFNNGLGVSKLAKQEVELKHQKLRVAIIDEFLRVHVAWHVISSQDLGNMILVVQKFLLV